MNFNYDELSLQELGKIQSDVKRAIASYHTRKRREAKAKVDELAKQYGYSSIEDLVSGRPSKKKGRSAQPYFRNPNNHEQTCAKPGRKPGWYHECLKNGYSEEQLKIENQ